MEKFLLQTLGVKTTAIHNGLEQWKRGNRTEGG
jgi:hypothetical protein